MIPVKLRVRNFMCYRDNVPDVQFDAFRVACLSGDNGNGKSALLDAITWCLWGQARARTDDELIHQGRTEMEVEFDFRLGDDLYRVVRKRTKGRSERAAGHTILELHVADADGGFRAITGDNVRETEHKISALLRMDYQTFINSAFLLQGRADEFTVKQPSERKKVLADILNLGDYDKLEKRARELAKQQEMEHRELLTRLSEIDRELERRDEYRSEMEQVQSTLLELDDQVRSGDALVSQLRGDTQLLEIKQLQVRELDERLTHARGEVADLESQVAAHRHMLAEHTRLLEQSEDVRREFLRLRDLRTLDDELNGKLEHAVALRQRLGEVQQTIERQTAGLRAEVAALQASVHAHTSKISTAASSHQELIQARATLDAAIQKEHVLAERQAEIRTAQTEAESRRAENKLLRLEMERLRDKLSLLDEGVELCPLCNSRLEKDERVRLRETFESEGRAHAAMYRANEAQIREFEQRARDLEAQRREHEAVCSRERSASERRVAMLEERLSAAEAAESKVAELQLRLDRVQAQIRDGAFAHDARTQLSRISEQLNQLGYDPNQHREIREQLRKLSVYDDRHCRLQQAENAAAYEKAALLRAETGLTLWREREDRELSALRAAQEELTRLQAATSSFSAARKELDALLERQSYLRQMLGASQQKLDYCAYLEQSKAGLQVALHAAIEERTIYEELSTAFGKKGVQAMIIESTLPELEHETNVLLGRMTDERMHVAIETQRDTRRGETIETLDIRISDELGARSYETFSGGEAFRVNFALRVALSKLLARRAGARLQTLIIDEGFGTQDASGREKLVEAITSIQDEFEKILVITHIQELKDLFATRLEVVKTDEGSTITIN